MAQPPAGYLRSTTFRTLLIPHTLTGLSLGAIAALAVVPRLDWAMRYPGFVVGAAAWDASNPHKNLLGAFLFMAGAVLVAALFQAVCLRLERKFGEEPVAALSPVLWAVLLPDCAFLVLHLFRDQFDGGFLALGAILKAALLAALLLLTALRSLPAASARAIAEAALVAAGLAVFDGLAVLTAFVRPLPPLAFASWTALAPALALAVAAALLAGAAWRGREGEAVEKRFRRIVWWLEAPLPLLALSALPAPGFEVRIGLRIFLGAFMAACWIAWRYRRRAAPAGVLESLTPLCLCAVLLFLYADPPHARPLMSADDFHYGEMVLPYQQWKLHGKTPYVDLNSPQGLYPWLGGAFSDLWYSGMPDTLHSGLAAVWSLVVIGVFLAARRIVGVGLGFLVASWFTTTYIRLALVTMALFLLASLVHKRPWRILAVVWFWFAAATALFMPTSGGSFLVGGALALTLGRLLLGPAPGEGGFSARRAAAYAALALLPLALLPHIYWGLARFIWDNAQVHAAANAVTLSLAPAADVRWDLSPIVFGIVRLSVLIAIVLLLVQALRSYAGTSPRRAEALLLALGAAATLAFSLAYSLGRVDPGYLSRIGGYSLWAVAILTPVLLRLTVTYWRSAHTCLAVALLAAGWGASGQPLPVWETLRRKPAPSASASPDPDLAVGRADFRPEHRRQLLRVKQALTRYLRPGETYIEWTNHSARYQYLGYPCPVPEMAAYNTYTPRTEQRVLDVLKRNPPPVVLVEADSVEFDGGPAPLRTPHVYRALLESDYTPVDENGLTLLVRPGRAPAAGAEDRLRLFERAFFRPDLRMVPVAWGRSAASLEEHMGPPVSAQAHGLMIDVAPLGLSGKAASFMALDFAASAPALVRLSWRSDLTGGESIAHVRFQAQPGPLIVPMDVHPRWYLSRRIESVTLSLDAPGRIENVRFRARR